MHDDRCTNPSTEDLLGANPDICPNDISEYGFQNMWFMSHREDCDLSSSTHVYRANPSIPPLLSMDIHVIPPREDLEYLDQS